jgi:NAD-specific glutamate dehydrogenase
VTTTQRSASPAARLPVAQGSRRSPAERSAEEATRTCAGLEPAAEGGAAGREAACGAVAAEIVQALENVANLNEDRVLRQYLALIHATTRTNLWRTNDQGARRGFLSFKFDPAKVPGLPEPKPMFEIFVYSARFEGVHLRGGRVARGGLRWSDRHEDFRTEVLGLVKAQMVKNTVIVPVGSKGGFVLKKAPPATDREAYLKEGVACYQDYLRGLLDLDPNVRPGYREIRVKFKVKGDLDEATVQELVRKSPVYDTLAHPVKIRIEVEKV